MVSISAHGALLPARRRREEKTEALLAAAEAATTGHRRQLHEEVIVLNIPLARGFAGMFAHRGIDREDLEQVAMVGLCKAVRGYRRASGHPFTAYAAPTILGELRRHFRDAGWLVRPQRSDQELGHAVRKVEGDLAQQLGRTPTRHELAVKLGRSTGEVTRAIVAQGAFRGMSLDAPVEEGGPFPHQLADHADDFGRVDDRLTLARMVSHLPTRDRDIVRLRFEHGLTQAEIGKRIGLSQMQVSRILASVLARLRAMLEAGLPAPEGSIPQRHTA